MWLISQRLNKLSIIMDTVLATSKSEAVCLLSGNSWEWLLKARYLEIISSLIIVSLSTLINSLKAIARYYVSIWWLGIRRMNKEWLILLKNIFSWTTFLMSNTNTLISMINARTRDLIKWILWLINYLIWTNCLDFMWKISGMKLFCWLRKEWWERTA